MPIYSPGSKELAALVDRALRDHHPHLINADPPLAVDILEARPKTDAMGEPAEDALKVAGYPCFATLKIRGPKDRGQGLGDVLLTVDAYKWPELEPSEQLAVLDHEFTHLEPSIADNGAIRRDDYGRPKLKIRLHDHQFGWFDSVAKRHPISSQEVQQARRFVDDFGQLYLPGFESVKPIRRTRKKRTPRPKKRNP